MSMTSCHEMAGVGGGTVILENVEVAADGTDAVVETAGMFFKTKDRL